MNTTPPDWLTTLAEQQAHPVNGFFGPDSIQWQISREHVLFVGGLRALLMQIDHPAIAHAGRAHSNFYADPFGRLERTFEIVHAMVFGSRAEAVDAAARLWPIHQRTRGTLPDGTPGLQNLHYRATDSDLLFWVYATLFDSTIAVCNYVLPQTDPAIWELFYEESKLFAQLCGVNPTDLPNTLADFHLRMDEIVRSDVIHVTPEARSIKDVLLSATPLLSAFRPYNQMVASGLLPEKLRSQFEMPWGSLTRVGYRVNGVGLRWVIPRLPDRTRYVPAYAMAVKRTT